MTGGAPAWVSYAALGISGIAVLVSFLSYRASGPRVRLKAHYELKDPANRRAVVAFTVVNEGRGDDSIVGFHIIPYGHIRKAVVEVENVEGPPLPHRLASNSQETWHANVLPAAREYDAGLRDKSIKPWSSWPSHIYFNVKRGNGRYVRDKSARFDARQLIADTYPTEET